MKTILIPLVLAAALFGQNPNTAIYPGGVAADTDLLVANDNVSLGGTVTLSSGITNVATSIPVSDASGAVNFPLAITIDSEVLKCTSKATNTLTCSRHFVGSAAAHSSGAHVYGYILAYHQNQLAAEVKAIETAATKSSVVPNTAPASGQIMVGNTGGTAYAPVALSGDCTMVFSGAITCTKLNSVTVSAASSASTLVQRNPSSEVIAANTVATGKTAMATDTVLASGQIPKNDVLTAPTFCAAAGASGTAYTCSLSPAITAYVTGTHYRFKADVANTGTTPSINLNSLGAKTIVKAAGGVTTALAVNDLRAGQWVDLVYDGTNMQMQSTLGNAAGGSGTVTTSGSPAANQVAYFSSGTAVTGTTTDTTTTHALYATAGAPAFRQGTAADATFTQSGTGAVATTVDAVLKRLPSIKDYGAVGNGTNDDTAALIAALAANNRVYVPPGTYKLTSTVTMPSGSAIIGAGAGDPTGVPAPATTTFVAAFASTAFSVPESSGAATSDVTFTDFSLTCSSTGSSIGFHFGGTYISQWAWNINMNNISVDHCGQNIEVENAYGINLNHVISFASLGHGLYLHPPTSGYTTSIHVFGGSWFNFNSGSGIYADGINSDILIEGKTVIQASCQGGACSALSMNGHWQQLAVRNVYFEETGSGTHAILLNDATGYYGQGNADIDGCYFNSGNTAAVIYSPVAITTGLQVHGSILLYASSGPFVQVASGSSNLTFHDNLAVSITSSTSVLNSSPYIGWNNSSDLGLPDTVQKKVAQERHFVIAGSGTAGVLQDTDDQPYVWANHSGGTATVTNVWCETDSSTALTMQFQKDDGSPTNMLSSNLSCTSTEATTSTFVSGENVLADGNKLNFLVVSAGGAAKWVGVHYTVTY